MVRRKCGLLIMVCLCLGTGCIVETIDALVPEPELPITVHAQDSWGDTPLVGTDDSMHPSERETMLSCIQEWNGLIAPRLKAGETLPFRFGGFVTVSDFEPKTDLLDGRTIIYKIPEMTPEIEEAMDAGGYPENVAGYGLPGSDAFAFLSEFVSYIGPDTRPDAIPLLLQHIFCHELGHVLGIQHQFVRPGVMNDDLLWWSSDESGRKVREVDVEGFCLVHSDSCQ